MDSNEWDAAETNGEQRIADSMGAGLVLTPDNEVNIVMMVGVDGENIAVPMSPDVVDDMIASLTALVTEARLMQEATRSMPREAAEAYLENWNNRLSN